MCPYELSFSARTINLSYFETARSRGTYISLFYHRALHSRSSLYRCHPRRFHDNPVVVHGARPTRKRLASLEIRQNRGTGSQLTSQFDFLRAESTHTSVPFDQEKRRYTPSTCRPRGSARASSDGNESSSLDSK